MPVEQGRARLRRVRRRQPLLRGDRRLHPPPRPGDAPSACMQWAEIDGKHAAAGRRQGQPVHPEPDVRPGRQARLRSTTTSGAARRPTTSAAAFGELEPIQPRVPRPRRPPRRCIDEQGLDGLLPVPDARRRHRGGAAARPRGRPRRLPRVQPLARRRLGLRLPGPHLRRAVHHAARPRPGRWPRLDWVLDARRPRDRDAGRARSWHPSGGRSPGDPVYDPFWARLDEAGITVGVPLGRGGLRPLRRRLGRVGRVRGVPPRRRFYGVLTARPGRSPTRSPRSICHGVFDRFPEPAGRDDRERQRVGRPAAEAAAQGRTRQMPGALRRPTRWRRSAPRLGGAVLRGRHPRASPTRSAPTACCSARTGPTPRAWPSRPTFVNDLDGFTDDEIRLIMRDNGLALAQRI